MTSFAARYYSSTPMNLTISLISYYLLLILIDKLFLDIKDNSGVLFLIFYAEVILIASPILLRRGFNGCHLIGLKRFPFSINVFKKFLRFSHLLLNTSLSRILLVIVI